MERTDPRLGAALAAFRPDVLVLPRLTWREDRTDAARAWADAVRARGARVVYDADDDLFSEAMVEHQAHVWADKDNERARREALAALAMADGVTVSTPPLADVVRQYTDAPVAVVPNAIDLRWWRGVQMEAERVVPGPTVGWAGGARPEDDVAVMAEAWARIARLRTNVTFVVQGYQADRFFDVPEDRIARIRWLPLEAYPKGLVNVDVGCCALGAFAFNACKSPIKAFEYAASGAAVVASPTVYGDAIEDGRDGFLCRDAADWTEALLLLLDSPSLRAMAARRLLRKVQQRHDLARTWAAWPAAWEALTVSGPARGAFPTGVAA